MREKSTLARAIARRNPGTTFFDLLRPSSLDVVHAGNQTFPLREGIRAVSLKRILTDLKPLR